MKIKTKFMIPLIILVLSVSVLLNYLFIRAEEKRLKEYLTKFGVSLAKNLSSNSEFGVLVGSKAELEKPIESIADEKDVIFAFILDMKIKGEVMAHSDPKEIGKIYHDERTKKMLESDQTTILQYAYAPTGEEIMDISVPIFNEFKKKIKRKSYDSFLEEDEEELFSKDHKEENRVEIKLVKNGIARVGISLTPLYESISLMKKKVLWITLGMIVILIILLTSLFRVITRPILSLAEAAKRIAAGDFSYKVDIDSKDEIGELASSFNFMSTNLEQSISRLEQTSDFNRSLISANNLSELLQTILDEILTAQGIKDGALMYYNSKREFFAVRGAGSFYDHHKELATNKRFLDWFVKNEHVTNIEDYLERFASELVEEYEEMQRLGVTMIIPLHARDKVIGLFCFGKKESGKEFTESNIRFLSNLIQSSVIAIDNIVLREKEAENEILKYELEFAKRVQESLLPSSNPSISGLDIFTLSQPAKDVGGDYYDFIELKEGGFGISIADVSGKGVPAALYMASTRGFLRSVVMDEMSSHDTLSKINGLLYEVCDEKAFVTMFYAVIDSDSRKLTYANAGHTFPLLYKDDDNGKSCSYLENKGLPLGINSVQSYSSDSIILSPGEHVLFYTDGIVEAMNDSRELFGFDRLEELVKKYGHLSAKEFVENIMDDLRAFVGENPFEDDLTLVAMRVTN